MEIEAAREKEDFCSFSLAPSNIYVNEILTYCISLS
jgi:hypothetical protein